MGVGRRTKNGRSAEALLAAFRRDLVQLDDAVARQGSADGGSDRLHRQQAMRDWLQLQLANPALLEALSAAELRDLEQDWRLRRVGLIRGRGLRLRRRRRPG